MMDKISAQKLVQETLQGSFNKERFVYFVKNLLNSIEEAPFVYKGKYIFDDFADSIQSAERIGKYTDPDGKLIDILIVHLKKETSLDRARTRQRNFVAKYLKGSRGGVLKDAALVAFVSPNEDDWRFSFVKMEYKFTDKGKVKEEFTPARRYSFLVGKNENTHTAQSYLIPRLLDDDYCPTLQDIEEAFSVEKVTKEFFEKYRDLFLRLKESLDELIKKDKKVKEDFKAKDIDTADFTKKLLGQIVFLYFLQKKGWFGVKRKQEWGSGSKRFLRELFKKQHGDYKNFFNDVLEPLFYEALRLERPGDYYSRFDCRIPFLNGGLFDPINDYDWWDTDILFPHEIFSNEEITKEGDVGTGILDVFDRYNFTVKEDEPLEKEVAIDPEMLGKVFENLLEVKDRKSKGTYYTPREIVHYMCQESLANYLAIELEGKVNKGDIDTLIEYGETVVEHDSRVINEGRETPRYSFKLPQSIRKNAQVIDEKLASIRVCDPAVGSGAFPVGMMNEVIRARNALNPYISENGERTPYNFKRHAIHYCLYGVDIDPSAIEIAKLRLWLSLIVDEEQREEIQPLPNLDYKMIRGNSLLGYPYKPQWTEEIEKLKKEFFEATSPSKKEKLKDKIDSKLTSFLSNSEQSLGYKVDFDFEIFFSEVFNVKKGFDVVIANPPYIDSESMVRTGQKDMRDFISKSYKLTRGNWDIYIAFFERGFKVLNNNGVITFITPDKWISKPFGAELRKNKIDNICSILRAGRKVFEEAKVDSIVSFFRNKPCSKLDILDIEDSEIVLKHIIDKSRLSLPFTFDFLFSDYLNILFKIESSPCKLSELSMCENACATSDAYKIKPLIKDIGKSEYNKRNNYKIINTGTIGKYSSKWGTREMTYLRDKYLYPVVDKNEFKKEFKNTYGKKAEKTKIMIKGLTLLDACIDFEGNTIPGKSTLVILNNDIDVLKLMLAIVNSKLSIFYIKERYSSSSYNQGINFTKDMINDLPIPKINENEKKKIITYVDKILEISEQKDYHKNISKQEASEKYMEKINQLLYRLYGLEPKEIEIVESAYGK